MTSNPFKGLEQAEQLVYHFRKNISDKRELDGEFKLKNVGALLAPLDLITGTQHINARRSGKRVIPSTGEKATHQRRFEKSCLTDLKPWGYIKSMRSFSSKMIGLTNY